MQQYEAHLCLANSNSPNTSQKFTRLYRKSPKGRILCSSFARKEKKKQNMLFKIGQNILQYVIIYM